ncbi:MAG: glycosyltransferase [Eubacterium sp.]
MMKACKVSIILPVYNTAKYLEQCVESLLNQTLEEIEIIAVNDGSTDNSLEILKEYQSENPNKVYVYNIENHGVSYARNFGLSKSNGEYIWFVDSDDFTEEDACERLYSKAVADNNDLVLFSRYDIDAQTGEKVGNKTFHFNQNFKASDKPYELVKLSPFPWNKFIKRELLNNVSFPEGIRFEDLPISFILFTRAKSVGVINDFLYDYRVQVGFLSKFTESTLDIVKAIDFLKKTLDSDGTLLNYKRELEYITIRHFCYRFEQLLTLYSNEDYELKKKLINTLYDYLDSNYPDMLNNPYLLYNLPDRIYRLSDFYLSKQALLDYVEKTRNMTAEEQVIYNAELTEKFSPSPKKAKTFDVIREKKDEKSLLFNTTQRTCDVENTALFISGAKKGISSSLLSVLIYVNKKCPQMKTVVACSKKSVERLEKIIKNYHLDNTEIIKRGGERYVRSAALARYVFADCPTEHYFSPSENQRYINFMTEYTVPKEIFKQDGDKFDFSAVQRGMIVSDFTVYQSKSSKDAFEEKYKVSGLGVKSLYTLSPELDINGVSDIKSELGLNDKKIVLLAPKYKAGEDRTPIKAYRKFMASLIQLDSEMDDSEIGYLCLDGFPFDADTSIFSHIKPMPEGYDLFDFAGSADVVVTNYHRLLTSCKNISHKTIRYITDEKMYIEDFELEIDGEKYLTCKDVSELLNLIHSIKKSEKNDVKFNECEKLFDAINNGTDVVSNESEEARVIYFLGGKLTETRIRTFKRIERNNSIKKYYLAFDEAKNPNYKDELLDLIKSRNYIPVRFDTNSSFDKKTISTICSKGKPPLFSKEKLEESRKIERRKYFGNISFDEAVMISVGEIERNLMFIGYTRQLIYSFTWFSMDKYNSKKPFKCKVDYICKELEYAQKVVIPEEMQGVKAIKNLKTTTEFE